MIDAEKLLGKVLSGAVQSKGKKKKKKKRKKSDDLLGGLMGGLSSGKGLIAAIGLGVGAYEIYKHQTRGSQPQTIAGNPATASIPPAPPQPQSASQPPPIPGAESGVPAMGTAGQEAQVAVAKGDEQELAILLLQTMVAAAHADGEMDQEEETRILTELQGQGLDREEKQFILMQLHHPKSIAELVGKVKNPMVAQTMYSLAASTIVVDTVQERQWLDELAAGLSISPAMQQFIEEEL